MTTFLAPGPVTRAIALTMIATEIAIHAYLAPDHLEEVPYIGVSFVVACVLLLAVAALLVVAPRNRWGWFTGAALCVGMGLGFALSRLFGLPDYHETWTSDAGLGLWSLPPEIVFVGCLAAARRAVGGPPLHRGRIGAPAAV
jgi:hypothetical protein